MLSQLSYRPEVPYPQQDTRGAAAPQAYPGATGGGELGCPGSGTRVLWKGLLTGHPMAESERRSPAAGGIVTTVRDRLHAALEGTPTPFPCSYAFLIHARRREGEHGFGVVTLAGESLPLSVAMLSSLERTASLIDGLSPVVLGPAEPFDWSAPKAAGASWNEILPVTRIALWYGQQRADVAAQRATGTFLVAGQHGPQLVVFCGTRPEGWPA